jgi:hypothetical protein
LHRTYLPIVPAAALRRFRVHEPFDHRFRASARLVQSIWRTERGLPIGSYTRPNGESYRLGSMITEKAGETGANFLTPEIARLARREVAYREPGALIEERRLWCNLLSSMGVTLNCFALLKLNTKLATKMLRALLPDLADATVEEVLFEHSPGRGDPALTADYTAFDVVLTYAGPGGVSGFLAIEVKYAESIVEPQNELNSRHVELATTAGLHKAPEAELLVGGPLQQFFRQHLLAQAMLARGYASGTFMVLAPALNTPVQKAVCRYAEQLTEPGARKVAFASCTLEEFIGALRQCGERAHADALHRRYLAWERVDELIEQAIADFGRTSLVVNDNATAMTEAA